MPLSTNQMKELRDAFHIYDRDKSGSITISELKYVLQALNLKNIDVISRKLMKEADTNGDGSIDFNEFVKAMEPLYSRTNTEEEIRRAFQCFDVDNSGYITRSEFRQVLCKLVSGISKQSIDAILNEIDRDKDGQISYEEFANLVQTMK